MSQSPTQPLVRTVEKLRKKIFRWQARWIADVLRKSETCYTPESLGARLHARASNRPGTWVIPRAPAGVADASGLGGRIYGYAL
jgi:hypothetical protein